MRKSIWAAVLATIGAATSANAALLISNIAVVDLGNGQHQWDYTVAVQPNANMRVVATVPPVGALPNDTFTLYDFAGYVPGSATLLAPLPGSTFQLTTQLLGITPARVLPIDNPALDNFSVALVGGADVVPAAGGAPVDIFVLRLNTTLGGLSPAGFTDFTGQTQLKVSGLTQSNIGIVQAPIPEPAALGLVAAGLPLLARRRRV
jgi:hypothetical protein